MVDMNNIHSAKALAEASDKENRENARRRSIELQSFIQTNTLFDLNEVLQQVQNNSEKINNQLTSMNKASNKQFVAIITVAIITLIVAIATLIVTIYK